MLVSKFKICPGGYEIVDTSKITPVKTLDNKAKVLTVSRLLGNCNLLPQHNLDESFKEKYYLLV